MPQIRSIGQAVQRLSSGYTETDRDGSKGTWWGRGGGVKANLTNSRRSTVEVWPTRVGQCWGLAGSSRSMLRFDRLESVNVEVWPTRIVLLNKILALAIFDGPTQSGIDQLSQDLTNSVSNIGGGGNPPPPGAIPADMHTYIHTDRQTDRQG